MVTLYTPFYLEAQAKLDARIMAEHNVGYNDTKNERLLALFVELAELANETRSFKYWSNKAASSKEILLEEYADGIHFFFSVALAYNLTLPEVITSEEQSEKDVTLLFLNVFQALNDFAAEQDTNSFVTSLKAYLTLAKALTFTSSAIKAAYEAKMVVNYNRQDSKY